MLYIAYYNPHYEAPNHDDMALYSHDKSRLQKKLIRSATALTPCR